MNNLHKPSGFTLIEVLVTLLIFSIGLLGCAGLQGRAQPAQQEAYQRVYAINLLTTMLEHISANEYARGCFQLGDIELGVGYTQTYQCVSQDSEEARQRAAADINHWDNQLKGTDTKAAGNNLGGLLNARGCIAFDAALSRYKVTVVWQGLTEASATQSSCGDGIYGGDQNSLRRLVSGTFIAPDLKS